MRSPAEHWPYNWDGLRDSAASGFITHYADRCALTARLRAHIAATRAGLLCGMLVLARA